MCVHRPKRYFVKSQAIKKPESFDQGFSCNRSLAVMSMDGLYAENAGAFSGVLHYSGFPTLFNPHMGVNGV